MKKPDKSIQRFIELFYDLAKMKRPTSYHINVNNDLRVYMDGGTFLYFITSGLVDHYYYISYKLKGKEYIISAAEDSLHEVPEAILEMMQEALNER